MKSYEQIAEAMYRAFVKQAAHSVSIDTSKFNAWDTQPPDVRECWIAAARQAAAELALVH